MTACCTSCNTLALGFGANPVAQLVGLILHWRSRYLVDPARGLVYGRLCKVMGRDYGDGYIRLGWGALNAGHQYAHRLIWETVYGPIPQGHYVDHVNGKRADTRHHEVRSWPIANIGDGRGAQTDANVRFRPKADIPRLTRHA